MFKKFTLLVALLVVTFLVVSITPGFAVEEEVEKEQGKIRMDEDLTMGKIIRELVIAGMSTEEILDGEKVKAFYDEQYKGEIAKLSKMVDNAEKRFPSEKELRLQLAACMFVQQKAIFYITKMFEKASIEFDDDVSMMRIINFEGETSGAMYKRVSSIGTHQFNVGDRPVWFVYSTFCKFRELEEDPLVTIKVAGGQKSDIRYFIGWDPPLGKANLQEIKLTNGELNVKADKVFVRLGKPTEMVECAYNIKISEQLPGELINIKDLIDVTGDN